MRGAFALLVLLGPVGAAAHDADILFVRAEPRGGGRVDEVATLTGATLALLAPVDADDDGVLTPEELAQRQEAIDLGVWESMPLFAAEAPCQRTGSSARLKETYVELTARFQCPAEGELKQVFRVLSVLPPGYRVIVGTFGQGDATAQRFAQGNQQTLFLSPARAAEASGARGPSGFAGWLWLGAIHIFTGYDHLAFLAALLLVAPRLRRLLWVVTSFTVAHSITLGATALGLLDVGAFGQQVVEVLIAASIVYVAAENMFGRSLAHRAAITFGFGLVHGFGFASVLRSYGLGDSAVAALAGFNLGVEAGQAMIVAALYPVLALLRRRVSTQLWTVRLGSAAIALAGLYWLITRLWALAR